MNKKRESFEWLNPANLPDGNKLAVVMKTLKTTLHPEDPEYPRRRFVEAELFEAGRSAIARPVGMNHQSLIHGAYIADANWSKEDHQVEAILAVPDYIKKLVEDGKIQKCSIEFGWRDEEETPEGTVFKGLWIQRVDLLEGLNAGDSDTSVTLFESSKRGRFDMSIKLKENKEDILKKIELLKKEGKDKLEEALKLAEQLKKLGEPFAGYTDFADCVAKNQDKEDPEAYCASIKAKAEPESKKETADNKPSLDDEGESLDSENIDKGSDTSEVPPETTTVPTNLEPTENPQPPTISEPKPSDYTEEVGCKDAGFYWYGEACHLEKEPEAIVPPDEEAGSAGADPETSTVDPKMEAEAVKRLQEQIKKLNKDKDKYTKEAKLEVVKLVEASLPSAFIISQKGMALRRLTESIKKVLYKIREE